MVTFWHKVNTLTPHVLREPTLFDTNCILQYFPPMGVITNRCLLEFSATHHDASGPLQAWRKTMESAGFSSFAELRLVFRSVDTRQLNERQIQALAARFHVSPNVFMEKAEVLH